MIYKILDILFKEIRKTLLLLTYEGPNILLPDIGHRLSSNNKIEVADKYLNSYLF
jgi:hypothetical protein